MNFVLILINLMLIDKELFSSFLFLFKKNYILVIIIYEVVKIKCLNCKNDFYVKRNFLTLFETKKYYICDDCFKKNPINFKYENVKLENFDLSIISMTDNCYKFNIDAYQKEISLTTKKIIKKDYFFIYLDIFKLNDTNIEIINFLANDVKKNILLLCFVLKK